MLHYRWDKCNGGVVLTRWLQHCYQWDEDGNYFLLKQSTKTLISVQFLRNFLSFFFQFPFPLFFVSLICCRVLVLLVGCTVFVSGSCLLLNVMLSNAVGWLSGSRCRGGCCWLLFIQVSVVDCCSFSIAVGDRYVGHCCLISKGETELMQNNWFYYINI